jgi:hypothetical protein
MLLFKKRFLELIRSGVKRQTIRLWPRPRVKAGQRSYIPGVGYIRIEEVVVAHLESLTPEDARLDGFDSLEALKKEIEIIYADEEARKQTPYRIKFSVLPENEQLALREEKQRRKASETSKNDSGRFVVLRHAFPSDHPREDHWDFMFERDGTLTTWALNEWPQSGQPFTARQLPPHRLHYLDYEGPLSDDRGSVTRYDAGTCRWVASQKNKVVLEVLGERLHGTLEFTKQRTKKSSADQGESDGAWGVVWSAATKNA